MIDALFDIYYAKKNFKKNFIFIALISIILALSLFWVPTLYIAILIYGNILNWLKIAFYLASKKETTIDCDDNYHLFRGNYYRIKKTIERPLINSKIIIYVIIGRKGKFDPEIIHTIFFNNILPKPLWYIKMVIYVSCVIYETITDEEMRRKNVFGKINVFHASLSDHWEHYLLNRAATNNFARGKKIIIKDRKINVNFNGVYETVTRYRAYTANFHKKEAVLINFNRHQHYGILKGQIGIHYTTKENIRINSKIIKTQQVWLSNEKQYLICGFYGENIIKRKSFLRAFFKNHGISSEEDFVGFWIKQEILIKNLSSNRLIFQDDKNSRIIDLNKDITLLGHHFLHEEMLENKNFNETEVAVEIWKEEKVYKRQRGEELRLLWELKDKPISAVPEKYKKIEIISQAQKVWEKAIKDKNDII